MIYSSKFGEDWWKIEGGVSEQQNTIFSLSLSYGGDLKIGKNTDGMTLNQVSAQPGYSHYVSSFSTTFRDIPSRIERVYPEHRKCELRL